VELCYRHFFPTRWAYCILSIRSTSAIKLWISEIDLNYCTVCLYTVHTWVPCRSQGYIRPLLNLHTYSTVVGMHSLLFARTILYLTSSWTWIFAAERYWISKVLWHTKRWKGVCSVSNIYCSSNRDNRFHFRLLQYTVFMRSSTFRNDFRVRERNGLPYNMNIKMGIVYLCLWLIIVYVDNAKRRNILIYNLGGVCNDSCRCYTGKDARALS
jgi:hypothetical protein